MDDAIKFVIKDGAVVEEFVVAGYARTFRLSAGQAGGETGPFECTREEWEKYLYPSGLFELVEKRKEIGVSDAGKAKDK